MEYSKESNPDMRDRATTILNNLVADYSNQRSLDLIAEFSLNPGDPDARLHTVHWYMCVTEAFRPALDIQETERTI